MTTNLSPGVLDALRSISDRKEAAALLTDSELLHLLGTTAGALFPGETGLSLTVRWDVTVHGYFPDQLTRPDGTFLDTTDLIPITSGLSRLLPKNPHITVTEFGIAVDLDQVAALPTDPWGIDDAAHFLAPVIEATGELGGYGHDLVKVRELLEEEPEENHLPATAWQQLLDQYSTPDAALQKVQYTRAWQNATVAASRQASALLIPAVQDALDELGTR